MKSSELILLYICIYAQSVSTISIINYSLPASTTSRQTDMRKYRVDTYISPSGVEPKWTTHLNAEWTNDEAELEAQCGYWLDQTI